MDVLLGGIDFSDVHLGGEACRDRASPALRTFETVVGVGLGCLCLRMGRTTLSLKNPHQDRDVKVSRVPLAALSLVFGAEVGYKLASRAAVHLLFPCHVVTAAWICLLATSKPSYPAFRALLNLTHGAAAGLLFPVADELSLPGEQAVYWLQHALLFILPYYLMATEHHAFPMQTKQRFPTFWPGVFFAFGLWLLHHFAVMQAAALATLVNVGHMLCAAASDPFAEMWPSYILVAIAHQFCATVASAILAEAVARIVASRGVNDDANGGQTVTNGNCSLNGNGSHAKDA